MLEIHLRERGLRPEVEYRFHPTRLWRFDFALLPEKVAAEVEGGIWRNGAHSRGRGFSEDCEKYNSAAVLGWVVLRFTPEMVQSLQAVRLVEQALLLRRAA